MSRMFNHTSGMCMNNRQIMVKSTVRERNMSRFHLINRHSLWGTINIIVGGFTIVTHQEKGAFIRLLKKLTLPVTSEKNMQQDIAGSKEEPTSGKQWWHATVGKRRESEEGETMDEGNNKEWHKVKSTVKLLKSSSGVVCKENKTQGR